MVDKSKSDVANNELQDSQLICGKDIKLLVKAIVILILCSIIGWKILTFDTTKIVVDFATLISVVLALFSIGLAVAFYHMANLSNQKFYSDSFAFTKDIAESLAKIDSGFGEKLNSIDSNYRSMKEEYKSYALGNVSKGLEQQDRIDEKEENVKSARDEQKKLIDELIEKANLGEQESNKFKELLIKKEKEINEAQHEIAQLSSRLNRYKNSVMEVPRKFELYFKDKFPKQEVGLWKELSVMELQTRFKELLKMRNFHPDYIEDLKSYNLLTDQEMLTRQGVRLLRAWLRNIDN